MRASIRMGVGALLAIGCLGRACSQSVDSSAFGGLSYRLIGPFRAGRSLAVTGVPGRPDWYFFGAVGGGVWKSENSGRTWSPIFDHMGVASIGAIAVSPSKPNVVYVGSGEADMRSDIQQGDGMYKSADGGKSWNRIGLEDTRQIGKILVDPKDDNVVYVAALGHQYGPNAQRGVFKTVDGGNHWSRALFVNSDTGAIDLAMDPADNRTILAAMWQTRRPPWNVYPPSSGPGSGLYKSSDAGKHWRRIAGRGLPASFGRVGLSFCNAKPFRLYAVVDTNGKPGGGIFVSDDKGENWKLTCREGRLWGRGWYFGGITADPKDPNIVYVMNTAMYRSRDGGKSFIPIKGAPGGDDYHTLWINPGDPHRMICGSDQGTIVSVDGAQSWSSWWNQPTGQFYHVIADADARFPYWVYGSQQDSGAMAVPSRTNHNIISMRDWRPMEVGGESGTIAIDRLHPGTLLDNGGTIERLEDGLTHHSDPTRGKPGGPWRSTWTLPIVSSPHDPKVFYTSHQIVFRSGDGGEKWEAVSADLSREKTDFPANLDSPTAADNNGISRHGVVYWLAPSPVTPGVIWAGTDDGLIWVTHDEGKHWEDVTPSQITAWSKVGIIDASHFDVDTAYSAIDRHRLDDNKPYIYRTRNGGKSWELIVNGLPSGAHVNVVREDPMQKGLLYCGTERAMFVSFDDGEHWQSLQLNLPPASMRDIVFAGNDIVVGTHGRAIWILDDVARLRQLAKDRDRETRLFKPSDAILFVRGPGFDDGTPLPLDEPRGENPALGAFIDYFLKDDAKRVELTIKDEKGNAVRSASSDDKPSNPDLSRLTIAPIWVHPGQQLSISKGGHRFVWEFGGRGPAPALGEYEVTLTVDGKSFTQHLHVLPDPRLKPGENGGGNGVQGFDRDGK